VRLQQSERGLQRGSGAVSTSDMVAIIHEVPEPRPYPSDMAPIGIIVG